VGAGLFVACFGFALRRRSPPPPAAASRRLSIRGARLSQVAFVRPISPLRAVPLAIVDLSSANARL